MLTLYNFFCYLNYPLWLLTLRIRRIKGKEHKIRYKEKLGICLPNPSKKNVIWVNALGLGETLSLTFFLQELAKKFDNHTILFTSSTLQSQFALEKISLHKNIIHQFAPVDNYFVLNQFLDHWRPKLVLFSELDIWPLRINEVKRRNILLLLINSRLNEKKKQSRKLLGTLFSEPIKAFDHIYLQDESSKLHFKDFGVGQDKITVSGPLKSSGTIFPKTNEIRKKIKILLSSKLIWVAASLHEKEMIEILEAHKIAKKNIPNLVLVLIPRSIEIGESTFKKTLKYSNFVKYRTKYNELPDHDTEILIVARVGELGLWYKLAFISFIGNSLNYKEIKTGKNPFEALQAETIVIHGPKMLEPGYQNLSSLGITDTVHDRYDISNAIIQYSKPESREEKIKNGARLILKNKQVTLNLIKSIFHWYKKRGL